MSCFTFTGVTTFYDFIKNRDTQIDLIWRNCNVRNVTTGYRQVKEASIDSRILQALEQIERLLRGGSIMDDRV